MPLVMNISIFDILDTPNESEGGSEGFTPDDSNEGVNGAVVGGSIGGCSVIVMVVVIALIVKKKLELCSQILASVASIWLSAQTCLTTIVSYFRRNEGGDIPLPPLPPRTYPRNLTDDEVLHMRAELTSREGGVLAHTYDYV